MRKVVWHITNDCCLDCTYCFSNKTPISFDIKYINNVLSFILENSIEYVDISGGEPLLYPHLGTICYALREIDVPFSITTKAIGLESNRRWLVREANLFCQIIFSLDFYDKLEQDAICNFHGVFDNTCALFHALKKTSAPLRINTVALNRPLSEFNRMCDFIMHLKPDEWVLIQPYFVAITPLTSNFCIEDAAFSNVCSIIDTSLKNTGIKFSTRNNSAYSEYIVMQPDGQITKHGKQIGNLYSVDPSNIID